MDDRKRQLVELIAREVFAALKQRTSSRGRAAVRPTPRADVRPPIGACTGDYSKFPELRGRLYGGTQANRPQSPGPAAGGSGARVQSSDRLPLTGIITANQLQQACDASPDGCALLADDARLTPLANDLARQHPEWIRRVDAYAAQGDAARSVPWFWWIDGRCQTADSIIARRGDRFRTSLSYRNANSIGQVVGDLASALKAGRIDGGVLFVHSAARANCYANRCPSIRAVVGSCVEAVEQGIRDLGANVLLIEYPYVAPGQIEAMVDRMIRQKPAVPPQAVRDLADLRRCE